MLVLLFLFSACCPSKKCVDGHIRVIPYTNGKYQLPAVPLDFYVVVHTDPGHRLSVVATGPENLNCNSDVSTVDLDCCSKYTFSLWVDFQNDAMADQKLDSVTIKIKGKEPCFIFDVDPNHN